MHTQPAFSSAKGTELTGMVPSESTESANERHKPVKDWKLTSDIQNIVGLSHWMNTIVPGTEHQHSIALEFNLGSMSAFLRDEYSDLKEPAEILQILTVTGSPQLAYADTAEAYLKWQWRECSWASSFLQHLASACISHSESGGKWPNCSVPIYF